MRSITITSTFQVYDSFKALPGEVQDLMSKAVEARENAYAPYSRFYVGAALLLSNSEIITGSNQENASYPSGLCAERTAVFYAGAKYPQEKINIMAISAKSLSYTVEKPIPPCGACRQSIAEYEIKQKAPVEIYFMGEKGEILKSNSLAELLPLIFDNSYL